MFFKLTKYEFKAIARTMLPLLLAVVGSSLLFSMTDYQSIDGSASIIVIIRIIYLTVILVSLGACMAVTLLRFKNSLFGEPIGVIKS